LWGALLCALALSRHSLAGAARVSAYAPPPPIPLDAAPPPELAPLEYPRRPFELTPEFTLALPSCGDACERIDAGLGLAALWRPTPFIAVGGSMNRSSSAPRDRAAFYGALGRVYFADRGSVEPYLELGLGAGASHSEAARAGGGVEFFLGRHVRLGPAFDWTVARSSNGFAAFSLRLSLLFGPGS